MATPHLIRDHRRFGLGANDNDTVVDDDGFDTEGHRLATNDNEPTVESLRRLADDEGFGPSSQRRLTPDIDDARPVGVRQR